MAEFKVCADFTFEADDITHAFELLATHFKNLSEFEDSDLIKLGKISINPIGE